MIGPARSGCVNSSNFAAKSLSAWETGRVRETQSPLGEITVGLRPFADANASKAATVSAEGCTKALTSSFDNHCLNSGLPGVDKYVSLASRPARLLAAKAKRRVRASSAGAAPWLMNPFGAAARLSWTTVRPAEAAMKERTAKNARRGIMAAQKEDCPWCGLHLTMHTY
jgi:hypothetical protein